MSKLIEPKDALEVVRLDLGSARASDFHREFARAVGAPDGLTDFARWVQTVEMAVSRSDYLEGKDVAHNMGKTSFTMITNLALALCTVVPTDTSTGATITEVSYTGAARKTITAANLSEPTGTNPTKITNSAELVFPNCTAGSSTAIGWALLDSATVGAGNIHYWGTMTSLVISTTQTPPSVPVGGLEITED